jgi:hypothetical protein
VALHEGNRGGENGKEDLPHVSGRTSVQLNKECASSRGTLRTGDSERETEERKRRRGED